jgi:hypothetical protein
VLGTVLLSVEWRERKQVEKLNVASVCTAETAEAAVSISPSIADTEQLEILLFSSID